MSSIFLIVLGAFVGAFLGASLMAGILTLLLQRKLDDLLATVGPLLDLLGGGLEVEEIPPEEAAEMGFGGDTDEWESTENDGHPPPWADSSDMGGFDLEDVLTDEEREDTGESRSDRVGFDVGESDDES